MCLCVCVQLCVIIRGGKGMRWEEGVDRPRYTESIDLSVCFLWET